LMLRSHSSRLIKEAFYLGFKHALAARLHQTCRRSLPLVPIVLDKTGVGERAYDIYSRLLKDRIVCLMGPINDDVASITVAQLLFLQSEEKRLPIHLYINSPGGIVTAGLAIYDTMQFIRPPIHTWCIGQASSMGSLLLTAGAPGHRYALPHSRIMIHQPSGAAQGKISLVADFLGQATDIKIQAEEIIKLRKMLNSIYSNHTKQPLEVIEKWMDRDYFMTADEAVEAGLVDRVLRPTPKGSSDDASSNT
uniref:ATP-dependent Clp protease proteolytic subunit n=1 Tax=Schistocephalus solidus TaxID=70667 RepID=A0A183TEZ5_SCHSO